jgi:hypothetical protein
MISLYKFIGRIIGKAINEAFGHVYVKNVAESTKRLESFTNTAQIIDLDY